MKRMIPEAIRNRALTMGGSALDWLAQLDSTIALLEGQWHIRVGDALPGGTHAFVAPAVGTDGETYIFKLDLPEEADVFTPEIRFLQTAQGRGYVTMHAVDLERRACLLERLGTPLAALGLPPREQMRILCDTLALVWDCPVSDALPDGRSSLQWFREFIPSANDRLGCPLSNAVVARALAFLDARERVYDPDSHVLIHGDANAQNILQCPDSETGFKLIDADGLMYEKAYDLGVLMREWREEYTDHPLEAALERCAYLHTLTGVDRNAIWHWGYLQCVATALTAWEILPDDARALAQMAEAWCSNVPVTLRPYRSADCPVLAQLFYDTVHIINARDYTPAQLDAWATGGVDLEVWDRSFLAHRTLVAELGGSIVGFADMDDGYLDRLYVHHAHQNQGIATALCDALEDGYALVTTHASSTARPFFERRGYVVLREQQVERHGVWLTNYVMEKRISPAL